MSVESGVARRVSLCQRGEYRGTRLEPYGRCAPGAILERARATRAGGRGSLFSRVYDRELNLGGNTRLKTHSGRHHFKNFKLKASLDTRSGRNKLRLSESFRRSSVIIEIVSAGNVVLSLTASGVCTAYDRDTNERLCFLNIVPDEMMRSLFYNRTNQSIITVSVYKSDNFTTLKCRNTPLEFIRRGEPEKGFVLFESESLAWPGFVEFDDVNEKVLTYSSNSKVYKVWDLTNYTFLYSIEDERIQEIKICPGAMLLIYHRKASHVPLRLLDVQDGTVLKEFKHLLKRQKRIDFVEQFNDKLLIKQENEPLVIIDARHGHRREIRPSDFHTPSAFIFLYENGVFLTFKDQSVSAWNNRGQLVTKFEDHVLWSSDTNTNMIYITAQQDVIVSYCRDTDMNGSINMSDISSGRLLGKIAFNPNAADSEAELAKRKALSGITALYYNEDRKEIYTGTQEGNIHVWHC